ncbi:MAG: hypothetical protein AAGD13_24985 [Pseudomonadota bacterium]
MTEFRVFEDLDDLFDWDVIEETLEETASGLVLVERLTIFDDLTERLDLFSLDGIRTETEFTDFSGRDGFGVMPWDTIIIEYDAAGELAFRETVEDSGAILTEFFIDGVRSEVQQLDSINGPDGAGDEIWDEIVTVYDLQGTIAARTTVFDDGVLKTETFDGGVRSFTQQLDQFGDAQSWELIDTSYDQNGRVQERFTLFDNDTSKLEAFIDGQRFQTFHFDSIEPGVSGTLFGAKSWSTIEISYDGQGRVAERTTVNDDGSVVVNAFENGVRQLTVKIDGTGGPDGEGANPWSRIETQYDATGQIVVRQTDYDDGRIQIEDFIDGQRVFALWSDGDGADDGAHDWFHFLTFYDGSGAIQATLLDYDDGDAVGTYYDGGTLSGRHILDGDDSEPWLGRAVVFGQGGAITEESFYFTEEELPDGFLDLPEVGVFA